MNPKMIFNYNKLCDKCKINFQKIMLVIKEKNPQLIKKLEFYQIIIDNKVHVSENVALFAIIHHNKELYGFFLYDNVQHLSPKVRQLLKQWQIILPLSILNLKNPNEINNVHQDANPFVIQQPNELIISDSPRTETLVSSIDKLKTNQQQIVQGLAKSFGTLKQRHKKTMIIFVLLCVILLLLFTVVVIGGWQLYLYLHRTTQSVIFDLSQIKKIKSPEMINAKDLHRVEANEIKVSLKYLILQEVMNYMREITFVDYDYELFSDDKGTIFQPVDLTTSSVKIWVMIKATPNSKFLVNNTNYLAVTLPMLGEKKTTISGVKKLYGPELLRVLNPISVTEDEIRKVYDPVVAKAVKPIHDKLYLNIDYSYKIYSDTNKAIYEPVNLVSNNVDIWIVIMAKTTSKLITGYTDLIRVALQTRKILFEPNEQVNKMTSIVVGPDGFLYVGTTNGKIWRVNSKDGQQTVLEVNLLHDIISMVVGPDGFLYVGVKNNTVYRVSLKDKPQAEQVILFQEPEKIACMVVGPDGFLYVSLTLSDIWRVDLRKKTKVVSLRVAVLSTWNVAFMDFGLDGFFYVGTFEGKVYRADLQFETIDLMIEFKLSEKITSIVAGSDGFLYGLALYSIWKMAI